MSVCPASCLCCTAADLACSLCGARFDEEVDGAMWINVTAHRESPVCGPCVAAVCDEDEPFDRDVSPGGEP